LRRFTTELDGSVRSDGIAEILGHGALDLRDIDGGGWDMATGT
jgi:hypothetical protein